MTHYFPVQIFYEDTDAGGIVYHANYLKYMERARTTFLANKGFSLTTLIEELGVQFVVRSIFISYAKPVRLQQNIMVVTKVVKSTKTSLTFTQNIYFDPSDEQSMICSSEVVIVCTNAQLKPCAIPPSVLREIKE